MSSFFSLEGQRQRLSNVAKVLTQAVNPFDTNAITANVENKTAKALLQFVANNPYSASAIAAVPATASARSAVASGISALSTGTKVAAAGATLVVVPAVAVSEKSRVAVLNAASTVTPERFAKLGSDLGGFVENPSVDGLIGLAKGNKGVLTAAALASAAVIGPSAVVAGANIGNTLAIKENTRAVRDVLPASLSSEQKVAPSEPNGIAGLSTTSPEASKTTADVNTVTPATPVLPNTTPRKTIGRKKKRKVNKGACKERCRAKRLIVQFC